MDTLPAAEDILSPRLPSRPLITISTLRNIIRLYNVDSVPTNFAERTDATHARLADRRTFRHFWLAYFLGSRKDRLQNFIDQYRTQKHKNTEQSFLSVASDSHITASINETMQDDDHSPELHHNRRTLRECANYKSTRNITEDKSLVSQQVSTLEQVMKNRKFTGTDSRLITAAFKDFET